MSNCLALLQEVEDSMTFTSTIATAFQAVARNINMEDDSPNIAKTVITNGLPVTSSPRHVFRIKGDVSWKTTEDKTSSGVLDLAPFLALPADIHFKIMEQLHPIDVVCLSLTNKQMYSLDTYFEEPLTLDLGSPYSLNPCVKAEGCRHCCPVLFFPAHCELNFHLRPWMPKDMKYCAGRCKKYTPCKEKEYAISSPESPDSCGTCGISFRRRFERGRKMLNVHRPEEKQERLNTWYNTANKTAT